MILLFAAPLHIFCKAFPNDPRIYSVLVLGSDGSFGSGCILQLSNSVYLLTAKRVLFDTNMPPNLLFPQTKLLTYNGKTNAADEYIELDLRRLSANGEVRYHSNREIALIRIEECQRTNLVVCRALPGVNIPNPVTMHAQKFTRSIDDVDVGADVFMLGYPISATWPIRDTLRFSAFDPLLRKGAVSGVNKEQKTILIDCPPYYGNSGGPVVQLENQDSKSSFRIIGVISAFVPFQDRTMGYTVVEPIDFAFELAWQ